MGLCANKMNSQVKIIGTVQNKISLFRPKCFEMNPKVKLEKIPAAAPRAAAQDASSNVIFPLGNGLSFDVKMIVLGLGQPN